MKEKIIVKMYGGSRMHGTQTAESDTDILGVFLPDKEDLLLKKAPEEYNLDNGGKCGTCLNCKLGTSTLTCIKNNEVVDQSVMDNLRNMNCCEKEKANWNLKELVRR